MESTEACLKVNWNDPVRRGKTRGTLKKKEDPTARALSLSGREKMGSRRRKCSCRAETGMWTHTSPEGRKQNTRQVGGNMWW